MATKPSRQLGAILRAVPAATVAEAKGDGPGSSPASAEADVEVRANVPISEPNVESLPKQSDAEVPLQVTVPRRIRRELMVMAADQDRSVRALILRAITSLGIEVAEEEMRDKRRKP